MKKEFNFKTAALFAHDALDVVVLSRGTTVSGKPFYAFAKIKPSRFQAFKDKEDSGLPYRIQDFGEILMFDYAETPPESVMEEMRNHYGTPLIAARPLTGMNEPLKF